MKSLSFFWIFICVAHSLIGQYVVNGSVKDYSSGEALVGVNIFLDNSLIGTISDNDGRFSININTEGQQNLNFSYVGYEDLTVKVSPVDNEVNVLLTQQIIQGDEVVVAASRIQESFLKSPITIEQLDLSDIQQSASHDYYDGINRLKGVTSTQASLVFNSINTRGFSSHGNGRFLQLQDGMDDSAPAFNFPMGSMMGISELDIQKIELLPGPASALYGPNAYNGLLLLKSKNPFEYQGLGAQVKVGLTDGFSLDPLVGTSIRYAKKLNDQFAFKINLSTIWAQDWEAKDYNSQRSTPLYGDIERGISHFDGVNLYGDENRFEISNILFTRTGLPEDILLDNRSARSLKADAALHYKLNENTEASLSYKYALGSGMYQNAERFAIRNFNQQFLKWDVQSKNWNFKLYNSLSRAGGGYDLTSIGTNIYPTNPRFLVPLSFEGENLTVPMESGWSTAVQLALDGHLNSILGIPGNDVAEAITFADQGGTNQLDEEQINRLLDILNPILLPDLLESISAKYPELNSELAANTLIDQYTIRYIQNSSGPSLVPDQDGNYSPELLAAIGSARDQGGFKLEDQSNLFHIEGFYNFGHLLEPGVELQVGANFRRYNLLSSLFQPYFFEPILIDFIEDDVRIRLNEVGAFSQFSLPLINERMRLTLSARIDKHTNFEAQISPRLSLVFQVDQNENHFVRSSAQLGFRNPTSQGQYASVIGNRTNVGGLRANAEFYEIYEGGAWSAASYLRSIQQDDPDLRKTIVLDYIKPENIRTIEIGYKGMYSKRLLIDFSIHGSQHEDFIHQENVVSKTGTFYRPYFNVPISINSWGSNLGFDWKIYKTWKLSGNANYLDFNYNENTLPEGFENFNPSFNSPTWKFTAGLTNKKLLNPLSMGLFYQWQSGFDWSSSFGVGFVPAFATIDFQLSAKLESFNSLIKFGVNNLLKNEYITIYGGPTIGRVFHLTWTYEQL